MPVLSSDIVVYGSQVMADDDTTVAIGGSIDLTTILVFTDISPSGQIEVVSSDDSDSQDVTVTGRTSAGVWTFETVELTGNSPASFSTPFERICKVEVSGAHSGTLVLRKLGDGGDLVTLPQSVLVCRRLFLHAASDFYGGNTRTYHEKLFFKNENQDLALTNCYVRINNDPSGTISFALEDALDGDDDSTIYTRLEGPSGYSFGTAPVMVSNSGNLLNTSAQGVWVRMTLNPDMEPQKFELTFELVGESI